MPRRSPLPAALKRARRARGLSQEAFSDVSGRTYLSALERGIKSPTLSKITAICKVLSIHPLTLLTLSYTAGTPYKVNALMNRIRRELAAITRSEKR
jgi:transcriptional regulator with XRE-family HTH domain